MRDLVREGIIHTLHGDPKAQQMLSALLVGLKKLYFNKYVKPHGDKVDLKVVRASVYEFVVRECDLRLDEGGE